jgi:hypothetical protein
MTLLGAGKKSTSLVSLIDPFGKLMDLHRWFYACSCVQIRNWFDYRNHICIVSTYASRRLYAYTFLVFDDQVMILDWWSLQVFEKLGPSLYDFLRKNSYRAFPIDLVREFARQILESVACEYSVHSGSLATFQCNYQVFWISNNIIRIAIIKFSEFQTI